MMVNILAILSSIMLLAPTFTMIVDLFDKTYAGNYFFHYSLTVGLKWGLAGPNVFDHFLGDCFMWGMAGVFVCLAHITIHSIDATGKEPYIEIPIPQINPPPTFPPTVRRRPYKRQQVVIKRPARITAGYVYLLRSADDLYKIGRTVDPTNRIRTFSVKLPFDVEYEHLIKCDDRFEMETRLHRKFAAQRVGGEWFNLSSEDVEYIKSL